MTASSKLALVGLVLATSGMSGCGYDEGGYACLASIEPAFVLEIRDSVTGTGRAVQAAAHLESPANMFESAFSDTIPLTPGDGNDAWREGPTERSGVYDISVTAPGYANWSMQDVEVPHGRCGVATVRFDVLLQPE